MTAQLEARLKSTLRDILTAPTPAGLWQIQKELLTAGGDAAARARALAGAFYGCLHSTRSKGASRTASRWAAALETAAVTSVGVQETLAARTDPLRRLLATGVTAMLEVGAAVKNAEAWTVEASLMYHEVAWYLYGELWDISLAARPELAPDERRGLLDSLVEPIVDPGTADVIRGALLVRLFQAALAARVSAAIGAST
jgi:hypothetical protein